MKKFGLLVVFTFFLALSAMAFVGCSGCYHMYDSEVISLPTCTTEGVVRYTCSKCSESYDDYIPARHTYVDETIEKATCTSDGKMKHVCSVCGYSYDSIIIAPGHKIVAINDVEATCQSEGKSGGTRCSVCDEVVEPQEILPIVDHDYVNGICKWCKDIKTYYITFKANDKVVKVVPYTVNDKTITEPAVPEDPYSETAAWEKYTLDLSDKTVNALYTYKTYKFTLNAEGGVVSTNSMVINLGTGFVLPIPLRVGYAFTGWYDGTGKTATKYADKDGKSLNIYTEHEDKTLYAQWEVSKCVVTFESDGGTSVPKITYNYGDILGELPVPAKTDMRFDGWYSEDGKISYASNTIITTDLVLYAKWIVSHAITNADQLIAISEKPSENYYLANDIDLKGEVWSPVNDFTGKLDGNNYTIKNFALSINSIESNYGFFRVNNGTVKNIKFADFTFNFSVNVTSNSTNISSVLVGTNNGIIENCELTNGSILFNYKAHQGSNSSMRNATTFGSIAGYNNGTVNNCRSLVDISATVSFTYSNTYNAYGNSLQTDYYIGGIIGRNNKTLNGSYYIGDISVQSTSVLSAGYNSSTLLYGISWVGGLIGQQLSSAECLNSFSDIDLTYKTVSVNGQSRDCARLGGVIGQNAGSSSVSACYSVGTLNGGAVNDNIIGGFIGSNADSAKIISSYSTVETSSTVGGMVGGFCGQNASVIQNSYSAGEVASTVSAKIGGFVGNNVSSGTVSKCYSTGDVETVGGNIGYFVGSSDGIIFKCYFMQGATLLSSGKYIDRVVEYNTIEGLLCSKLWSDEFLVDELYWNSEGWVIVTDENPLLEWEINISHNFDTIEVEPTCIYGGFTIYNCSDCNRLFIKDFVEPTGHDYEDVEVVDSLCDVKGYTLRKCSICGDEVKVNYTDATGHKSSSVTVKSEKSATCLVDGLKVLHCADCGNDFAEVIYAEGHNGIRTSTVRAATCSAEGEDEYYCMTCGESYAVVTDKLEHNLIDVAGKSATCGIVRNEQGDIAERHPESGITPGVRCADCDYVAYGCQEIKPHNFELVETLVAPACGVAGAGKYKCAICDFEENNEVAALSHTDADRNNICDVCGELSFTTVKQELFVHINDVAGLQSISNNPSGYYWLDDDIDLSDVVWTALGTAKLPFKGILYGNGHTISGLTVSISNKEETTVAGLFGYNYGTIANLNISSFSVTAQNADLVFGGIAAYNRGSIINCSLKGESSVELSVTKTVTENNVEYKLEHDYIVGGLIGVNEQSVSGGIYNCTVEGSISNKFTSYCAIETKIGTTVWQLLRETLINYIYNTKVSTIQHVSFGGVVGRNEGAVNGCAVTGNITSYASTNAYLSQMKGQAYAYTYMYAGALAGYNSGSISDCSVRPMTYNVPSNYKYVNVPYMLTGKSYSIGYQIVNYAKQPSGMEGIIGSSSALSAVENITTV